jgi:ferrous iron transport protein A
LKNLSDLKVNESGTIKGFLDNNLSLKLLEMGCLPGIEVKIQMIAPFGDPIALSVSGYSLSIRKKDAKNVLIED